MSRLPLLENNTEKPSLRSLSLLKLLSSARNAQPHPRVKIEMLAHACYQAVPRHTTESNVYACIGLPLHDDPVVILTSDTFDMFRLFRCVRINI